MTFRQQAEELVLEARCLRVDDAIALIEARLQLLYTKGEKAGIEAASQSIRQIQPEHVS